MHIIRQIFRDDVKHVGRSFFALVIAIGVCFLSPLYAWANIYSNWDPYGNTGNLKLAAVSLDTGYTDEDGVYHNSGQEIIDNLHENDKIDWQFVDTKKEAVDGVKDGKYYGAIVISSDFTYNMYNVFLQHVDKPQLVFYQNQKKNPVANKITDTVINTLKSSIDEAFVRVMTETVFQDANGLATDIRSEGGMDGLIEKLQTVDANIRSYENMIDMALQGNAAVTSAISEASAGTQSVQEAAGKSADSLDKASSSLDGTQATLSSYSNQINTVMNTVQTTLQNMQSKLQTAQQSGDTDQMIAAAAACQNDAQVLVQDLAALNGTVSNDSNLPGSASAAQQQAAATIASMSQNIDNAKSTIDTLAQLADDAGTAGEDALENAKAMAQEAETQIDAMQQTFDTQVKPLIPAGSPLASAVDAAEQDLTNLKNDLNDIKNSRTAADMQEKMQQAKQHLQSLESHLQELKNGTGLTQEQKAAIQAVLNRIVAAKITLDQISNQIAAGNPGLADGAANALTEGVDTVRNTAAARLSDTIQQLQSAQTQYNTLVPQMQAAVNNLQGVLGSASSLMRDMSSTLAGMGNVFGALEVTVNSGSESLANTRQALVLLDDRITNALVEVKKARDDERVKVLMNTLSGDPDQYGEFFAEPVEMTSDVMYPVSNYGSAVTPFYTALAIWVGGLLLCAIFKTRPDAAAYPDAKLYQMYFGRLILFLVMGQISTLITVIGDLNLLHAQCVHPFLFWLACAIAGVVFTTLIYSLVFAFGDVGKAIAVVVVVLQIAGSSGTYPIELLPSFFAAVYRFFPFPYAIDAMRECIAGMYRYDYVIYLLELSVFFLVSLVIGLLIRKPFRGIMDFMEKRMDDTEMM